MKHQSITGKHAIHPMAFVGATDPSLDADNEVAANKAWIDTSGGTGNYELKVRNAANNGWELLGGVGAEVLDDLTDVTTYFPQIGDRLVFNGSVWANEPDELPVVSTETGTTYNVLAADVNKYIRLTNGSAKSIIVDPDSTEPLPANGEWHFRNVGAGSATIVEGSGVTVNEPTGGTLVIPQGGTVTLKRVAADTFDLMGLVEAV